MKGYRMMKSHNIFIRFSFNEFHNNTSVAPCMESIEESPKADLGLGNLRDYKDM